MVKNNTYNPKLTNIYHQLESILVENRNDDLLQQFRAFFKPYVDQGSTTFRENKECLQSQIILRKILEETRAYGSIYEFYYMWKHPYQEEEFEEFSKNMDERDITSLALGFSWVKDFGTVLECGSGVASVGLLMAKYNKKWLATDVYIPTAMPGLMKAFNTPADKYHYMVSDATKLDNIPSASIDVIISQSLYEHFLLDDALDHISCAFDRLKPGGKLSISVPSSVGPPSDISRQFVKYDKPVGFHIKEYNAKDMYHILKKQGFSKVRFKLLRSKRIAKMGYAAQMINYVPYAIMRPCELFALALYWPFRKNITYRKIWMKVFYKLGFASTVVIATK